MQVKSKRTGNVKTISAQRWDQIVANGFASEFEVLTDAPMPEEVAAALSGNIEEGDSAAPAKQDAKPRK